MLTKWVRVSVTEKYKKWNEVIKCNLLALSMFSIAFVL